MKLPFNIIATFPNNFSPIEESAAKLKYPYEERPDFILSSFDNSINFCIDKLNTESKSVEEIRETCSFVIKKNNPATVIIDKGVLNSLLGKIGYFDIIKIGLDINIYILIFIAIVDDIRVFGNFNVSEKYKDDWKPIIFDILKSFRKDETYEQ